MAASESMLLRCLVPQHALQRLAGAGELRALNAEQPEAVAGPKFDVEQPRRNGRDLVGCVDGRAQAALARDRAEVGVAELDRHRLAADAAAPQRARDVSGQ